jgi:replicative superfamily II helicase
MDWLEVRVEPTPSTRNLKRVLQKGVAFHHVGLLPEERVLIENGFKAGKIRLVSATTTLIANIVRINKLGG